LIQYLIKLSVSLAVVYLFYRFILRPLTFYTWNRWYLAGYSLIAFIIPFIDINPILNSIGPNQADVIRFIPVIDPAALENRSWINLNNRWNWVVIGILSGILVMLIRLGLQFLSYHRLRSSSVLLSESPVKIFQVDKNIVPFSFGNSIFINRKQHGEREMQEIIRHEFIHVKEKHTADMIWAEILCILNWYNPFAWLIKKVICQNLEFIADQQVLKNGLDKKEYQYLLLKVAGGASFRITNQFNFSFLRKRILMMNKMKSARLHMLKFLFVLPMLAVLLLSFRERIEGLLEQQNPYQQKSGKSFQEVHGQLNSRSAPDTVPVVISLDTLSLKPATVIISSRDSNYIFSTNSKQQPLFIVDEVIRESKFVKLIDPASIDRVEILKDKYALQYGDKGKNGVVRIHTKSVRKVEVKHQEMIELSVTADKQVAITLDSVTIASDSIIFENNTRQFLVQDSIQVDASLDRGKAPSILRIKGTAPNRQVLYIIDGVKQPLGTDLRNLDSEKIESINVIKDAHAVDIYGSEAANGVIIINTKAKLPVNTVLPRKAGEPGARKSEPAVIKQN
ncbi:MAG: M56 family peptidase, partial [Chitinophagaceae bacterium]